MAFVSGMVVGCPNMAADMNMRYEKYQKKEKELNAPRIAYRGLNDDE